MKIKLIITIALILLLPTIYAAYWVNNPANCPNTNAGFPGQECAEPEEICGNNTGIAQCYDTDTLTAPAMAASTTDQDSGTCVDTTCNGGWIVNCFATADAGSPYCDNSGAFWCDRNSTCYTTQVRQTNCTASVFGNSVCGLCRSGYYNCYGDTTCESTSSSACSGSANNYYVSSTCVDATGGGTCVCNTNYFACDGSETDGDGCEFNGGGSGTGTCGSNTGWYKNGSCLNTTNANCTASGTRSGNRDCNNGDADSNSITCNPGPTNDGCEITAGTACLNGTTAGTGGTWVSGVCIGSGGNCTSAGVYLDCDNSDADGDLITCNTGNGCEVNSAGSCTVGTLTGTYGGDCTCDVSRSNYTTGVQANYSTSSTEAMIWGRDWGSGPLFNFTNNNYNQSLVINASGCIIWYDGSSACTAPTGGSGGGHIGTSPWLYNDTTNMYWNDTFGNITYALIANLSDYVGNWSDNKTDYVNYTALATYANKTELSTYANMTLLSTYTNQTILAGNISGVYTALAGYVNMTNLGSYANKTELSTYANMTLLSTYANQTILAGNISGVYTALGNYVNATNLSSKNYTANRTDVNFTNITISSLANCDTINTTAEGLLVCGSDANTGGAGSSYSGAGPWLYNDSTSIYWNSTFGNATYVNYSALSTYANQTILAGNISGVYTALAGYVNMTNLGSYANKTELSTYVNMSNTSYFLTNGTRPMFGNVNVSGYNITNVSTLTGNNNSFTILIGTKKVIVNSTEVRLEFNTSVYTSLTNTSIYSLFNDNYMKINDTGAYIQG